LQACQLSCSPPKLRPTDAQKPEKIPLGPYPVLVTNRGLRRRKWLEGIRTIGQITIQSTVYDGSHQRKSEGRTFVLAWPELWGSASLLNIDDEAALGALALAQRPPDEALRDLECRY
jgi:hypothetical protein